MKMASWTTRKFFKPEKVINLSNGISTCEFSLGEPKYKKGDCFITPMKSGKKALVRIYEIWTPSDPGDQHFYRYEFIRYIKEGEINE